MYHHKHSKGSPSTELIGFCVSSMRRRHITCNLVEGGSAQGFHLQSSSQPFFLTPLDLCPTVPSFLWAGRKRSRPTLYPLDGLDWPGLDPSVSVAGAVIRYPCLGMCQVTCTLLGSLSLNALLFMGRKKGILHTPLVDWLSLVWILPVSGAGYEHLNRVISGWCYVISWVPQLLDPQLFRCRGTGQGMLMPLLARPDRDSVKCQKTFLQLSSTAPPAMFRGKDWWQG